MVLASYKVNDSHVLHARDAYGIDVHTRTCTYVHTYIQALMCFHVGMAGPAWLMYNYVLSLHIVHKIKLD